MTNKFESLLELLINEENEKAEALFHEIVVEKSREIYEGLAEEPVKEESKEDEVKETEASEEKVEETTEDESVEETSKESNSEESLEEVELEDEATDESEKSEEESIEEVGGDATDELVKDISADEEGAQEMHMGGDKAADDMGKDMDGDKDDDAEDMEDRVVDLEDALDDLKAEFEKMMMDKKDGDDDEDKDEAVEMPAETPAEPVMTGEAMHKDKKDMKKEAMHKDKKDMKKEAMHDKKGMKKEAMHGKDKKKMDEYKIQKSADTADHSDKGAKSPVKIGGAKMGGTPVKTGSGADEKGRPAPTAEKMSDFQNSPGKDKGTSFKQQVKADTKDGSEASAKSPISGK